MCRILILILISSVVLCECAGADETSAIEKDYPILRLFKDLQFHVIVDSGFNYNFNEPRSRSNSNLRVFDRKTDSFTLNLVEISFDKDIDEDTPVGFRLDLDFGKDANIIAPADTDSSDEFDLQEGYLKIYVPVGSGMDLKFGKFVTLLGAEVIEAPFNYNYSRSFLFGLAIPFTHTGILGTYKLNTTSSLSAGIVNGWDIIEDNNDSKTFLGNISFSSEDITFGINGIYGAEQEDKDSPKRWVVDTVLTIVPDERFTVVLNYDYGEEEDAIIQGETAMWQGVAGYIHYNISDTFALTARSEFFEDNDGARTGTTQDLWEITLTGEFRMYKDVLVRIEYRYDRSSADSFTDRRGNNIDTQDTIALEIAYNF